jgi:hypothetical protein
MMRAVRVERLWQALDRKKFFADSGTRMVME